MFWIVVGLILYIGLDNLNFTMNTNFDVFSEIRNWNIIQTLLLINELHNLIVPRGSGIFQNQLMG